MPEERGGHTPRQPLFAFEREGLVAGSELQPVVQSPVARMFPAETAEPANLLQETNTGYRADDQRRSQLSLAALEKAGPPATKTLTSLVVVPELDQRTP